jgi:hypothetical protein
MIRLTLILILALIISSCSEDDAEPVDCPEVTAETRFFEFQHESSQVLFIAWTDDESVLNGVDAQLELPLSERNQHINGRILRNDTNCPVNFEWSWHFDPNDWSLAEQSIELCDGNPQYVEDNLDEYVRTGRYCPWGSVVFREIPAPF